MTFHAVRTALVRELKPAMTKAAAYYRDTMVGVAKSRVPRFLLEQADDGECPKYSPAYLGFNIREISRPSCSTVLFPAPCHCKSHGR